jgi:Transcriptional Coactivator p15 (PC4)
MAGPQIVHEFELEHRGTVRATIDDFKGKRYASVRLWVEPSGQMGADLIPTGKGLSVPIEYASDLLECVQALAAAVPKTSARRRAA